MAETIEIVSTDPMQQLTTLENLINSADSENLKIPSYQRPYKWTEKNVTQLLEDIFEYVDEKGKNYRIGSIILHEDEEKMKNIVDGQQRLVTISLLLKKLNPNFNKLLMKQEFEHKISKDNIIDNYKIIGNWLNAKGKFKKEEEKASYFKRILEKCEFVLFTVYNQDEAFQLFDSQNARGKELEPYDLLKAFHLREMSFDKRNDEKIIEECVELWENFIYENELKSILGNHLFRIRKWSKNELKYDFTKNDIDEFKGISLYQQPKYAFERIMKILDNFERIMRTLDNFIDSVQNEKFPFSVTMPIINGKRFFEYVAFYIELRRKLFDNKENTPDFSEFYHNYCLNYKGAGRSGDEKVRNLYENILLSFIDKFGFERLKNFYSTFYKITYIIRCKNGKIRAESILKNNEAIEIFRKIDNAISPDNLRNYQYKTHNIQEIDWKKVNGLDKIKEIFDKEVPRDDK